MGKGGGRAPQAEGTVHAKALGQGGAWCAEHGGGPVTGAEGTTHKTAL
jgi:hypothetical protein